VQKDNKRFRTAGIKQLLLVSTIVAVQISVFLLSAGHTVDARPWIFFIASFLYYSVTIVVQYKFNPELLVQRLKMKGEGSKLWDLALIRATNITVMFLIPAVAGLDVGRFLLSSLDLYFVVIGLVLFIVSTVLVNWAMLVNPYFEPTVRIQRDRGHQVMTGGPYKTVRHPGYLAGILYTLSIPLIIGSIYTFIPVGIYVLLMLVRTSLEDKTLRKELNGYPEYARKVRYKLLPRLW
jgi:protein-S-isoprenylcysteine O-methyltransferase Ste14